MTSVADTRPGVVLRPRPGEAVRGRERFALGDAVARFDFQATFPDSERVVQGCQEEVGRSLDRLPHRIASPILRHRISVIHENGWSGSRSKE